MSIGIKVNTDDSLGFDANGKLKVKVSPKTGNTLTVESDGLYSQAIPGQPGSSGGTGFSSGYRSANGIKTGEATPYSTESVPLRIVAPAIVQRVFTATDRDGLDINIRNIDRVYPGDFYRVFDDVHGNWDYYIILSVNTSGNAVRTHSEIVASISVLEEDVN